MDVLSFATLALKPLFIKKFQPQMGKFNLRISTLIFIKKDENKD